MSQSGEKNTSFGVFRSECCGFEIVIRDGSTFPECSKYSHLATKWMPVIESEGVLTVDEISRKKKTESAA